MLVETQHLSLRHATTSGSCHEEKLRIGSTMGKRSDFQRRDKDKYFTPKSAVLPLLPHLKPSSTFVEPCAGDGALIRHLEEAGHRCHYACDIDPEDVRIAKRDALDIAHVAADYTITNPPWTRSIMHPLIEHFVQFGPTWFLADANWMFTKQATPYLKWCSKVVTIGRVKWIEDSKMTGKDDSVWYLFEPDATETVFVPRMT